MDYELLRLLSNIEDERELDQELGKLSGERCPVCGDAVLRVWEQLNGACSSCKPPADTRSCACPLPPGFEGRGGYHFIGRDVYERCPAYWGAAGYEVLPEKPDALPREMHATRSRLWKLWQRYDRGKPVADPSRAALEED